MRTTLKLLLGLVLAVTTALAAGSTTPASAITGHWVRDTTHPYVGMVVFYDANGEFTHRCSGSLLTPTVLLTAGHCTDATTGATSARVYFQQDAGAHYDPATEHDPTTGYPDTCAAGTLGTLCATSERLYNYGFEEFLGFPNTHDAGLVLLDQSIALPEYGVLAAPHTLDRLATKRGRQAVTFTSSGYGLSYSSPVAYQSYRERLMAESRITNLRSSLTGGYNLQTNGNGATRGGTCSGDSGGPVFYGTWDSNLITSVTSFGLNAWCRGTDFSYRVDRAAVHNWIHDTIGDAAWSQVTVQ